MHELSITESILKIAVEEAKKHDAAKVTKINIKMGELSDLLPECINEYFSIISKGTAAEDAAIEIVRLPIKAKCNDCGSVVELSVRSFRCINCRGQNLKIVQGNEFYIDSLEVE